MAEVGTYLEKQIEELVKELETEEDPKRKEQLRQDLKDFVRLRNEEIKMDYECSDKVDRLLLDRKAQEENAELKREQISLDQKVQEENKELKTKQRRTDIFTAVLSGAITVAGIVANILMMGSIMDFEQTGTIRSKAFQFIGKANLFKKV